VRHVLDEAARSPSIVLHTMVSDDLRHLMFEEARRRGLDAFDLMGPVLERLATHLKLSPQEKPGLLGQIIEQKSRAIEAVDFAFKHDDGQRVDDLEHAEVVLVGISRTMKTPTSLYLAYRGWFAANVPLVDGMEPPSALLSMQPSRIFCLVMSPARLAELRMARANHLRMRPDAYASMQHVRRELEHAERLCRAHGWSRVDVTGKSVEEVAREIAMALPDQDAMARWRG
jgi:regulator of PEP synthase PpsR (kinase-PPPase family)